MSEANVAEPAVDMKNELRAVAERLEAAESALANLPVNTPVGAATHEAVSYVCEAVTALRCVVAELTIAELTKAPRTGAHTMTATVSFTCASCQERRDGRDVQLGPRGEHWCAQCVRDAVIGLVDGGATLELDDAIELVAAGLGIGIEPALAVRLLEHVAGLIDRTLVELEGLHLRAELIASLLRAFARRERSVD